MSDADDERPARTGFDLLSDGTRLDILLALADRLAESPENPAIGFADLRHRVGRRDSGNFNYHLDKLDGRFVTKTDDGYRIAPAGLKVVGAVLAGVYGDAEGYGPVELGDDCRVCGEPFAATYEDGLLDVACPNGHRFRTPLPPGAFEERSLESVVDLAVRTTRHDLELAVEGVCSVCYGDVDPSEEFDADGVPEFVGGCSRCGARFEVPAVVPVCLHPAGAAFYYEHGVDVRRRRLWAPEFHEHVEVDPSVGDGLVRVTVELDGDVLAATLDESLSVCEVSDATEWGASGGSRPDRRE